MTDMIAILWRTKNFSYKVVRVTNGSQFKKGVVKRLLSEAYPGHDIIHYAPLEDSLITTEVGLSEDQQLVLGGPKKT